MDDFGFRFDNNKHTLSHDYNYLFENGNLLLILSLFDGKCFYLRTNKSQPPFLSMNQQIALFVCRGLN